MNPSNLAIYIELNTLSLVTVSSHSKCWWRWLIRCTEFTNQLHSSSPIRAFLLRVTLLSQLLLSQVLRVLSHTLPCGVSFMWKQTLGCKGQEWKCLLMYFHTTVWDVCRWKGWYSFWLTESVSDSEIFGKEVAWLPSLSAEESLTYVNSSTGGTTNWG